MLWTIALHGHLLHLSFLNDTFNATHSSLSQTGLGSYVGALDNRTAQAYPILSIMAQNRGSVLVGITWMEVSLTVIVIIARFYTQVVILDNLGISDWLMLLAVVRLQIVALT